MAGAGVEALGGLGQAEQRDLLEVVEVDAAVAVATGHRAGDARVGLDEVGDEVLGADGLGLHQAQVGDDAVGATGAFLAVGRAAADGQDGQRGVLGEDRSGDHGFAPNMQ